MTVNRTKDDRRHRRISLEENDGVYCIVVRALSAGKTITLPAMDFSETGFKFAVVPNMIEDFFEGEKIYLKAIAGSRNLTFKDPLKLEIKWQKSDPSRTWAFIGCEIVAMTFLSKIQLLKFIEAEEKFRGIDGQNRLNGGTPTIGVIPESGKDLQTHYRRILTVSGGSPQNGILERVLHWVEDELQTSGHHVERIDLITKTVKGCDDCGHCTSPSDDFDCIQKDDAQSIIDKLVASDVIIYASPLNYWGFSSQFKALLDRCHNLIRGRNGAPLRTSSIKGQRQALIVTTADPFDNNAEPLLTIYNRIIASFEARSAGVLFVCNCSSADALGEEIKVQSIKFAKNLFGSTGAPYPVLIPGRGD
jgi:NAD(P)H-dependent FMN reductase